MTEERTFNWQLSIREVILIMGLVVPGVMAYTQLQTKVANIERAQAQEKQDRRENYREIIALLKETRSELRQDIKILRQSINRQRSKQRER